MNAQKMERIERDLDVQTKKVLAAVPMTETWTASQICGELVRTVGTGIHHSRIMHALNSLKNEGLVLEPEQGKFIRRAIKEQQTAEAKPKVVVMKAPIQKTAEEAAVASTPPADTLSRIAELSSQLKKRAGELLAMAAELDDVGVVVEERIADAKVGSEKLRQLQDLLRGISLGRD